MPTTRPPFALQPDAINPPFQRLPTTAVIPTPHCSRVWQFNMVDAVSSRRNAIALGIRLLGAAAAVAAVALRNGWALALLCAAASLLLIPLAWRPKAARVPGALCSISADLLSPRNRHVPGELSVTSDAITWLPSKWASNRGYGRLEIGRDRRPQIEISGGPALLDLTVIVMLPGGDRWTFRTHRSRALRRAISGYEGSSN